jgi:NitT/TauT family transport system ATP-binding protein
MFNQTVSGGEVAAIDGLDLSISRGEIVAIVGKTGCGKSTFLDILIGLEHPTSGRLEIAGKTPYDDFEWFRGKIGTIFQRDHLLPWRTSLDNVCLPLELLGIAVDEQVERARTWLDKLGLARFTGAYPHELSGGMRQRVAIARAFALKPEILLADESFSALDEVTAAELRRTFSALTRESGSTALLVTHQLEEAIEVGDRILVFGRSAHVLADIDVKSWPPARHAELREAIQLTLSTNNPDPRIRQQTPKA